MDGSVQPGEQKASRGRARSEPEILEAVAHAAVELRKYRPQITEGMSQLLRESIEQLDEPELLELMAASIDSNISTLMDAWEHAIAIDRMQPPTAAVEYARRLVHWGIPSSALTRAYHLGAHDLLEVCFDVVELVTPIDQRYAVIRTMDDVLHSYVDWITGHLLAAYAEEQEHWVHSHSTMHASLIHALLNAPSPDAVDLLAFTNETGYRLDQGHLGLIIHGADETGPSISRLLHQVGERVGAVGVPLYTAVNRATTWAWLPLGRKSRRAWPSELLAPVVADSGCQVAVGSARSGADGFRRTHRQALQGRALQVAAPGATRPVVSFGDTAVAVVARLAEDPTGTRLWVAETLGALARDGESEGRLRETLLVFLSSGGSYAHSAEALKLHTNTVKYRVRKASELRGRRIDEDRLDVELALQACRYLGERVLSSD